MKLVRSLAFYLSIASIPALAVACGGTVEHTPQTSASASTKAPIGTNTHGVVRVVGEALSEVPLRTDQRTEIERLAADAEARHAPLVEGRKELMLAFAEQIEQGSIDKAALQSKIDRVKVAIEKSQTDDRLALVKLHDILDAEQRGAFVDTIQRNMKAKRGEEAFHGLGRLKQISDELKLTDEQKTQLHDVLRDAHRQRGASDSKDLDDRRAHGDGTALGEWKNHHGDKKALDAFRADKLDLDKVAPPHDLNRMVAFGAERMTGFVEKVLPILTPEQRKMAADKVRTLAASDDGPLFGR